MRSRRPVRLFCTLVSFLALSSVPQPAGAFIYWANDGGSGGIGRRANDGSAPTISAATTGVACGVAVDGTYGYWTDTSGAIGRQSYDGVVVEPTFIASPTTPCMLSVDGTSIFWTDSGSATIGKATITGANPVTNFTSVVGTPGGVASNGTNVYFSDTSEGTIGIIGVNGSGVNQNLITNLASPKGIAVDAGHIYWASSTTIGRANLNGSNVNTSFITGANGACGVAVDATYIYWTNQSGNAIGRATLAGGSVDQSFITDGVTLPCGIAVDALVPTTTTTSTAPGATTTTTSTTLPGECPGGFEGVGCVLDLLLAGPLCGSETVDPKLQKFITAKLTRAKVLLPKAEAATKTKKRHKLLTQMDHLLKAITTKTDKAVTKQKVSDTCGQAIDTPVGTLRELLGTLG